MIRTIENIWSAAILQDGSEVTISVCRARVHGNRRLPERTGVTQAVRAAGEANGRQAAGGERDRQRGRRVPGHGRVRERRRLSHSTPQAGKAAGQPGTPPGTMVL